ncbi:ABC transporter permease subunit [Coprothermobacteraceae bacterium]|nr:ABC transporter permease subunit [Coprothermobacteraceae bacterium]
MALKQKPSWFEVFYTYFFLIIGCVVVLFPIYWIFTTSLRPFDILATPTLELWPKGATFSNYINIFKDPYFYSAFTNSVKISLLATALGVLLATAAAYAFSRFEFPGKKPFYYYYIVSQMFPSVVGLIPLFVIFLRVGLLSEKAFLGIPLVHWGLIIAYGAGGLAFSVWNMKGFFDAIPKELDEAAMIDGASSWTIFWKVTLPLAKPGIAITALFIFMGAWLEFVMAMTFMSNPKLYTLPLWINLSITNPFGIPWAKFAAASLIIAVPVTVLFLFLQRFLLSGLLRGAIK